MRKILTVAAAAATMIAVPAQAQQAFSCVQEGNTFYYRVGPGEFRNWAGAGNGYAARWLANGCTLRGVICSWNAGVLTLDTPSIGFRQKFNTVSGVFRWGARNANPTVVQCYKASDPPPD